jgi:hypothetical protein
LKANLQGCWQKSGKWSDVRQCRSSITEVAGITDQVAKVPEVKLPKPITKLIIRLPRFKSIAANAEVNGAIEVADLFYFTLATTPSSLRLSCVDFEKNRRSGRL